MNEDLQDNRSSPSTEQLASGTSEIERMVKTREKSVQCTMQLGGKPATQLPAQCKENKG
jgi:hypothetical protein